VPAKATIRELACRLQWKCYHSVEQTLDDVRPIINRFVFAGLSFAKTPHEAILVHVTCYALSLYVIDFICALDFGEAQLFFIHLESRQVKLAGFTPYPDQEWMEQQARNMTMEEWGCLRGCCYVLHDRDAKFCQSFRELIKTGSVNPLRLPARSPNLNSYAERWVRSVKEECQSRLILFGESSLRRALQQYIVHYHEERNHQGKGNRILFPSRPDARRNMGAVQCRERLGGLLKYYEREAA